MKSAVDNMRYYIFSTLLVITISGNLHAQNGIIVFQSDFGLKDGAVSAMKGVANAVSDNLKLYDLTHEIPAFNIWEAAYRLEQTVPYWPSGTVFVSVVDPGVGTDRKSVVLKTSSGHFIVTPDNGTLTLIARSLGIDSIREIDEVVNRRKNSGNSYTFHGRDVYAFTAAKLAAHKITFSEVGQLLENTVVSLPYQQPVLENGTLKGGVSILDVQYGNVWTNISDSLIKRAGLIAGDKLKVRIYRNNKLALSQVMPFAATFGEVPEGSSLAYLNSLMQLSFAINLGNFAEKYKIASGSEWRVEVSR